MKETLIIFISNNILPDSEFGRESQSKLPHWETQKINRPFFHWQQQQTFVHIRLKTYECLKHENFAINLITTNTIAEEKCYRRQHNVCQKVSHLYLFVQATKLVYSQTVTWSLATILCFKEWSCTCNRGLAQFKD